VAQGGGGCGDRRCGCAALLASIPLSGGVRARAGSRAGGRVARGGALSHGKRHAQHAEAVLKELVERRTLRRRGVACSCAPGTPALLHREALVCPQKVARACAAHINVAAALGAAMMRSAAPGGDAALAAVTAPLLRWDYSTMLPRRCCTCNSGAAPVHVQQRRGASPL
jgi:hypothetical protein